MLGTFGARGPGLVVQDLALLPVGERYDFRGDTIYNLECSAVIREGKGAAGAHNDIARSELAHAVWEAALAPVSSE